MSKFSNFRCKIIKFIALAIVFAFFSGCAAGDPEINMQPAEKIDPIPISDFLLGPGDVIRVFVWRQDELSKQIQIDPYGKIYYPLIGEIAAAGKSAKTIRELIEKGLSKYYVNPVVNVDVAKLQSRRIYVLGEVTRPGNFYLDRKMSVLEAISLSGGFTNDAKKENILVMRTGEVPKKLYKFDMDLALDKGDTRQNITLQDGDIVYVPALVIADIARYGRYMTDILRPLLMVESGIVLGDDVNSIIEGDSDSNTTERVVVIHGSP